MSGIPILITGATGYIGAQLVFSLIRRFGQEVQCRAMVREGSDVSFLKGLPVQIVRADLHDPKAVLEAAANAEVVFHCAGLIAYTKNYRNRLYETNVLGTRHVVNACLAHGVRRLIATSSIAAIGSAGNGRDHDEADEQSAFNEWQRRNVYMESKHLAELECQRGVAEGLDVVMVNPGVVAGRGGGERPPGSSSNEVLALMYRGRLPFCPSGGTGFADVQDVASAHIAAWQKGRSGERYIIVGENISFRELFDMIARIPGSSAGKAVQVSAFPAMLAGAGGELWSMLTGKPSFLSIESVRLASRRLCYSNSKSVRELGITYRPLLETLQSIVSSSVQQSP